MNRGAGPAVANAFSSLPSNLTILSEHIWRNRLEHNYYDVIVAQNETNMLDIANAPGNKLLVLHNRRSFLENMPQYTKNEVVSQVAALYEYLQPLCEFVYISDSKQATYAMPGRVIYPGIDVEEFGGYTGEEATILRVGNEMHIRTLMFDFALQEELCKGLPTRIVGQDPTLLHLRPADSYAQLLQYYRQSRCLLHISRQEYEDGYNLSMLEALACGTPVVSLANRTSPLTDGVDGFLSYDPVELRERLVTLLENPDLARSIGEKGRETVAKKFPISTFVEKWKEALFEAADRGEKKPKRKKKKPSTKTPPSLQVAMHYISSPLTTGRYFELAAREKYDVLTMGFRVPEEVLKHWKFTSPPPPYPPHTVDTPLSISYPDLLAQWPTTYEPDVYLWIDSGAHEIEAGIGKIKAPKVAYIIDSHVSPELRLAMARHFDCVFMAHKAQLPFFKENGIENVHWMPLACWPPLHEVDVQERTCDVAYVGSFSIEEDDRRRVLLGRVAERFPNSIVGRRWPREMARIYAQSKIVVNACFNNDVNMRVFEALASGSLLITDPAEGLEELFTDGEHLVIYRNDEELLDVIQYYLEHPEERERIAAAGRELVLAKHTYRHRLDAMMKLVESSLKISLQPVCQSEPKAQLYYNHPRRELLQYIPFRTNRLLDIGCGAGSFGALLKKERGVSEVFGIELIPDAWKKARNVLDGAILGNIEKLSLPFEQGYFDCIVCADVLEHLIDPVAVLRKLSHVLADDGVIVISIPNARYHQIISMLASGAWTYYEAGIMDSTHLRFFTEETVVCMVKDAGLEVAELYPLNMARDEKLSRETDGALSFASLLTLQDVQEGEKEAFLTYQWLACVCKPNVDRLQEAREALARNQNEAAYTLAMDAVGIDEFERYVIIAKALRVWDSFKGQRRATKVLWRFVPTILRRGGSTVSCC